MNDNSSKTPNKIICFIFGFFFATLLFFALNYLTIVVWKTSFIQDLKNHFANDCDNLTPIVYEGLIESESLLFDYELAKDLLIASYASSQEICVVSPNPPGYSNKRVFYGTNPINSKETTPFALGYWTNNGIGNRAILSFSGTVTFDELQSDFQFELVDCVNINNYKPGMMCHKGFYDIYQSIRKEIWEWYKSIQSDLDVLYITGISLGGAESTLAALDFSGSQAKDYPALVLHYSFASPRVFNIQASETFNEVVLNTWRIENTEDIVPSLPPPVIEKQVYQHVKNNIPFTLNLGNLLKNHVDSYKSMPNCPEIGPTNCSFTQKF